MRLSVFFNLDDPEIWQLVSQGRVHEIAPERHRAVTYLQGLHAIREFPAFQSAFNTWRIFRLPR